MTRGSSGIVIEWLVTGEEVMKRENDKNEDGDGDDRRGWPGQAQGARQHIGSML